VVLIQCNDPLTKTPKLTRAKNIAEWTTYDRQVAELAQRLLRNGGGKDGGNGTVVDESMFVQIDSSSQKDTVAKPEEVDTPEAVDESEGRERDEL
jgi:UDP-glucose:glycoprotein glucosyltransferase